MKIPEHINRLFLHYLLGELLPEQKDELDAWRRQSPEHETVFQEETDREKLRTGLKRVIDSKEVVWKKIQERYPFPDAAAIKRNSRIYYTRRIAAVLIFLVSTGLLFLYYHNSSNTIQPGRSRALFSDPDGIINGIDDFSQGFLKGWAGVRTDKNKYGEEALIASDQPYASRKKYYTLYTPRGGQFCLQLPDSTLIWLNAQSSIHFPANFSRDSIRIIIEGEAYFEIDKGRKVPLELVAGNLHVESAGAWLNVRSYPNEPIKATVLDGAARLLSVSGNGFDPSATLLEPRDQAQLDHNKLDIVKNADVYQSIAWKKGRIYFKDVNIQTILAAISRWYDVDIRYECPIPVAMFDLDVPRESSIKSILDTLRVQGAKLELQGKTIVIRH